MTSTTFQPGAPRDPAVAALLDWRVLGLAAVWLVTTLALGRAGVFYGAPGEPPLPVLIAGIGPVAAFLVAYALSRGVRVWADRLDLGLLTALQAWRVLGGMFLMFWALGLLPAAFAAPAGIGDVLVGLAAPFVAYAVATRAAGWRGALFGITVAGLLDFAVAFAMGVLTSPGAAFDPAEGSRVFLSLLPLSIVPTFFVPAWTILHVITLLRLRRER